MSTTIKSIIAIVVIALIIIGFWYYGAKPATPNVTGPIKIGAILSLTGDAAAQGDYALKAIKLAEEEINKNGGVNGRSVQVVIEDDQTTAKDATTAFSKLINVDKVDGVIGSLWDFTTQPLIPLALTSSTTLISPTNFRIAGGFDLNNQSFVMLSNLSEVIAKLKQYLADNKIK
ncbi:MAG: ABC transporter substrate-binding protein, partial [Candidatus Paceibacterota bacterium]